MMPEHDPARSSKDLEPRVAAIETSYKGYRFRSRLEARWAVFFDHLKWSWKYEPQGYVVDNQPYLPDFWVDELGWVGVKGWLDRSGLLKLGLAASPEGLPWAFGEDSNTPAGTQRWFDQQADEYEAEHGLVSRWTWLDVAVPIVHRLLLVGDIPEPNKSWAHIEFGLGNGRHVVWRRALFAGAHTFPIGDWLPVDADPVPVMPHGCPVGWVHQLRCISDAYRAARSARFEHGESGAA